MDNAQSHVLARKYRPQVFADLIGQDVLVRTITNAIACDRLAHAYMLTGIRGVGKTSSARIIAKGLNCIGEDGQGGMTPNPCGKCRHCLDIAADSHIDVIEIDAASNTGVDNVREIIEGAKYNPVSARFKIYIIDEVHMLSKQAFNALLKTLEEPPARIKFIFATTEIRKVPITILSRCQRFDLRRLDEQLLSDHLGKITASEGAKAEEEALHLIARAGDGSVRDSLSLLDQAITQFNGDIKTADIRDMLGLADRTGLFGLYEAIMSGRVADALNLLDNQYNQGADPLVITQDMMDLTHWLTRVKIMPELANDLTVPESERVRGKKMAESLSMASLTGVWQMLLKGVLEVKGADNALKALEMLVVRLAYAADLPSPAQILEDIKKNSNIIDIRPAPAILAGQKLPTQGMTQPQKTISMKAEQISVGSSMGFQEPPVAVNAAPVPTVSVKSISDMAKLAREKREMLLAFNIENHIRPIEISDGKLVCSFTDAAPDKLSFELTKFLTANTGINWTIETKLEGGTKTQSEVKEEKKNQQLAELKTHPVVGAVLNAFKGAKIEKLVSVKKMDFADEPVGDSMENDE
ncbi:MAG: DNA polymerase III subunit gamma/tau [Alphaproteobacteria bacterium]|nr:DNA polymerase III subunit gamma/tau [Alphaproteobacteria bacterium]